MKKSKGIVKKKNKVDQEDPSLSDERRIDLGLKNLINTTLAQLKNSEA